MKRLLRLLKRAVAMGIGLLKGHPVARYTWTFFRRVGWVIVRHAQPLVLFERHSGLGDVVCSLPAALALKQKHPGALIVFTVKAEFAAAVEMAKVADFVVPMNGSVWTNPGWMDPFFDFVYRPQHSDEAKRGVNTLHLVDSLCASVGVTARERQPVIHVSPAAKAHAREILQAHGHRGGEFVCLHAGPSWSVKEWTPERWQELGNRLRQEHGWALVQLGADTHFGFGSTRAPRVEGAADLVGKLNLEESIACISLAKLFIGIDSGLLHVAGAVGTPAVGLFGPTAPDLIMPPVTPSVAVSSEQPCLGCNHREPLAHWRNDCVHGIACMRELSAEVVSARCAELLGRTAQTFPSAA